MSPVECANEAGLLFGTVRAKLVCHRTRDKENKLAQINELHHQNNAG